MKRSFFVRRKFRALRLIASILGEGVLTFFHMAWFPFHLRAERARMRAIILDRTAPLLLGCTLLLAAGCSSFNVQPTFYGHIDSLQSSIQGMALMPDAEESLKSDLASLADGSFADLKETIEEWGW